MDSVIFHRKTDAGWRLYTRGPAGELPAGARLLRAQPWPVDRFVFDTEAEAVKAVDWLTKYLERG